MVNIGSLIEKKIEELGMSKAKFSELIGKTRSNSYDIFTRTTIDTELLKKISEVLKYDFFQHYTINDYKQVVEEPITHYGKESLKKKTKLSIMIEFDPDMNILMDEGFSQKLKELMSYVSK